MRKPFPPILSSEVPYYMSAIGMSGARFAEGDPAPGVPAGPPVDPKPAEPAPTPKEGGDGDEDKFDGPGGPAALKAEREARAKAEKDLAEAKAALQQIEDAKLSDIDKAKKDADAAATRVTELERDNWRLAALADHPVSTENRDLVVGTDAASYLASAKRLHDLESAAAAVKGSKPGYVPKSGTDGGDPNPSGGSLEAGRETYNKMHKKTS